MGRWTNEQIMSGEATEIVEGEKLIRATMRLHQACERGQISEHDRDERIARAESLAEARIAFAKGESRPTPRKKQPLDDPDAGKVA